MEDKGMGQHKWVSQDAAKWTCELCDKVVRPVEGQTPDIVIKQLSKISEIDRVVSAALYPAAVQFQSDNNSLSVECISKKAKFSVSLWDLKPLVFQTTALALVFSNASYLQQSCE